MTLFTAEAEYIATGSVEHNQQTINGFGLKFGKITIFCHNTSTINLLKNPIQHSRAKDIDIRHHFLKDIVKKGDIILEFLQLISN